MDPLREARDGRFRGRGRLLVVELGAQLFGRAHRFEHAQHHLSGARPMCVIGRLFLKELGVRQDDPELIVQTMEEDSQDLGLVGHVDWLCSPEAAPALRASSRLAFLGGLPDCFHGRPIGSVRIAPERVDKNSDRAACRADVLDFAGGEPVVNCAAAHPDQLARLHDRNRFSLHLVLPPQGAIGAFPARL